MASTLGEAVASTVGEGVASSVGEGMASTVGAEVTWTVGEGVASTIGAEVASTVSEGVVSTVGEDVAFTVHMGGEVASTIMGRGVALQGVLQCNGPLSILRLSVGVPIGSDENKNHYFVRMLGSVDNIYYQYCIYMIISVLIINN